MQGKMGIFATKMFSFLKALNIIRIFDKKSCRDEIEHDFCSNIWVGKKIYIILLGAKSVFLAPASLIGKPSVDIVGEEFGYGAIIF